MRQGLAGMVVGGLVLAATPSAWAQAQDPAGRPTPALRGQLQLSLADAIAMGIENNLDVEIVRHDPFIAEQGKRVAWGAYDPTASAEFGYASAEEPISNPLLGTGDIGGGGGVDLDNDGDLDPFLPQDTRISRLTDGSSGLAGLIPWLGGFYEIGYDGQRRTTNATFESLSPRYEAGVLATLSVPLMRGLFWSEPWTEVKLSAVRYDSSLEDFRRRLMDIVLGIDAAYWNLLAREEDLRVARKSLETAQALLDQTQAQYEVGVLSRVEVVEAEAGVADRDFRLVGAENRYRNAQDQLVDAVLGPYLTPESRLDVQLTDRPEQADFEPDAEQAAELAFQHRPELEIVRKQIEQDEISLQFAKNQRLPQLDLVGSYGWRGIAGDAKPIEDLDSSGNLPGDPDDGFVDPGTDVARRYHATDDDFFNDNGDSQWSARAIFSIPLGNRRARGRAEQARIGLRRSRTQLRRLEQQIISQVRESVRDVKSSAEGIEAAERRRIASEEQLRAERIRLEHGESTPFDVLQREEDLVEAESQKIFALQAYQNSLANLDRSQGTILRNHNVVVEEARALR